MRVRSAPSGLPLTLLSLAVEDVAAEKYDSDHYDTGVLSALAHIKNFFHTLFGRFSLKRKLPSR